MQLDQVRLVHGLSTTRSGTVTGSCPATMDRILYSSIVHYIHDVTAQSFDLLRQRGLKPRSPERIFGTAGPLRFQHGK